MPSLKDYNTFGIDVNANLIHTLDSEEQIFDLLPLIKAQNHFFLGGGSNVLFTKDYEGVIVLNRIKGIRLIEETSDAYIVESGAGEVWHEFVLHSLQNNWYGLENLSLIPGTVGASPIQNIGAYGVEIIDVLDSVRFFDFKTQTFKVFTKAECKLGYRDSIFKNELKDTFLITSVRFKLSKSPNLKLEYGAIKETLLEMGIVEDPSPQDVSRAVIHIRSTKLPDPKVIGNCGSFFKNPVIKMTEFNRLKGAFPTIVSFPIDEEHVKVPAAWLIDQAGWKGQTFGAIGVHKNQALVLVNYGGGKGEDIKNLAYKIIGSVKDKYNVELSPEVNIL